MFWANTTNSIDNNHVYEDSKHNYLYMNLNQSIFYINIKVIKNYFSYKDPIPDDLKSFLVYKFTCASLNSSYIGQTCHLFKTGFEESMKPGIKSHILKHLHSNATCFDSYNYLSFKTIDKVNFKLDLKIVWLVIVWLRRVAWKALLCCQEKENIYIYITHYYLI